LWTLMIPDGLTSLPRDQAALGCMRLALQGRPTRSGTAGAGHPFPSRRGRL